MSEQRKLAAILAADVVGFSRMVGADEDRILARLRTLRSDVIDPTTQLHNGRVVKRMGDGVLVEFRSVVDAVRCAIEIQTAMLERNAGLPEERRIVFRIGIHLGDVVEETDGDLMGDGVNIAARLEGIAAPGAICLSEDAYRQVKTRLDLLVQDMGPTHLKNIVDPLRVYALQVGVAAPAKVDDVQTIGLTGKPSIAVLPFTNMSGDPEQEYFVDGMVEDIITALSRFNQLLVVARNSSFTYKGRAVDIRQVARELGVRFVLEGGVRKAGNRLRITGQLIDAATGTHLWAERYDGGLEDVFDLQDQITAQVVGAIVPAIRRAEIEAARRKPADNLDAYDLFLRALPHVSIVTPQENLIGLDYLNQAIALDPGYAPALGYAAWCLTQRVTRDWPLAFADDRAMAETLARRAITMAGGDAVALALGGFTLVAVKIDLAAGLDACRRAISLTPGSGFVGTLAGAAMVWANDLDAAIAVLDRAMAIGSLDPSYFLMLTMSGAAHLYSGRAEIAVGLLERAAALNPGFDSLQWALCAAYTQLGRTPEAQSACAKFRSMAPDATIAKLTKLLPLQHPTHLAMVMDALRKAGLPE
jgi:adenylate cyclase